MPRKETRKTRVRVNTYVYIYGRAYYIKYYTSNYTYTIYYPRVDNPRSVHAWRRKKKKRKKSDRSSASVASQEEEDRSRGETAKIQWHP